MKTATENYVLSGTGVNIPVPHDCEIRDVREENDYLVIDFEDVSYHDSIKTIRPDVRTLTMRFHLNYGGVDGVRAYGGLQGIYRHRCSKKHGEGYMRIKNIGKLLYLLYRRYSHLIFDIT